MSKHDATELQRKLEGELFDKWEERYEEMEAKDIAIADIPEFLDHMQEAYEGTLDHNWAALCENVSSGICGQRRPRSDCADAQSDQGLHCPLTVSLDTTDSMYEDQGPG